MSEQKKIKIFVVDDDNLTIDLLVNPFRESGFIDFVGRANSGEDCLRILRNKPVDLVLMDINMPGIDGVETTERLLAQYKDNAPRIIFLTVYSDFSYAQKAFDLKASLLGKNIGIEYLLSSIERVCAGEIIINPNPKGITKEDSDAKLKYVLNKLLNEEQLRIACLTRNGRTADEISLKLEVKKDYVNNQKKEIYKKLRPLKEEVNAAFLGALMERSGLCPPLELNDLDKLIPSF